MEPLYKSAGISSYGLQNAAQGIPTPQQSEVNYAGERLNNTLERLESRAQALIERLDRIMRKVPQEKQSVLDAVGRALSSDIALGLDSAANRVDAVDKKLTFILETLAI